MAPKLEFNGTSDYVGGAAVSAITTASAFSVRLRAIIPAAPSVDQIILAHALDTANRFGITIHTTGQLRAGLWNGSTFLGNRAMTVATDGTELEIVYVFNGSTATLTVNGVTAGIANNPLTSSPALLTLGSTGFRNAAWFVGRLWDLEVRNASDVAVLHWPFDEGAGATLNDAIGSNDGTIVGATWVDLVATVVASYVPDAILASTNVSGAVAAVQTAGGDRLSATVPANALDVRFSFFPLS